MFAEIQLSFVFLCNTGKAGHISIAVWDAEEREPLQCGMQIYENIMQISIVPVFQNKQTNKQMTGKRMITLPHGGFLTPLKGLSGCVCVCIWVVCMSLRTCVHMCMHMFVRVTEEKQWDLNVPRKLALQLFFAVSWDPRMPSLVRSNNYYWCETGLDVCSVVRKEVL